MILAILAFVFGIGLIILVHEAGHFYFAKKAGVLCHEFSIGFGPAIWKKKVGETMITLRAIPIGGYVAMADSSLEMLMIEKGDTIGINLENGLVKELIIDTNMDHEIQGVVERIELLGAHGETLEVELKIDEEIKTYPIATDAFIVASSKQKMQITPYERSFDSKKVYQRALTMSAGVIMNFILAIVIYLILSFAAGVPNFDSSVIGEVSTNFPAYNQGLMAGDEITAIKYEGVNEFIQINSWTEFQTEMDKLSQNGYTDITIKYERNEIEKELSFETYFAAQNIGLTNIEVPTELTINDVKAPVFEYESGVQIGNIGLKYGKSSKVEMKPAKGEKTLTPGDYITGIKVYKHNEGGQKEFTPVNSWKDIITALSYLEGDVGYVYFEFFDQQSYSGNVDEAIVTTSTPVYTYSNALLDSQDMYVYKSYIGVSPTYHFSFGQCIKVAFQNFWRDATVIFRTLKELIAPSASIREVGPSNLSGFVGIFGMVKQTISNGFGPYLALLALLSVNIGIMNLLPIPALDGGRLVFLGYEAITRKKAPKKFETILNNVMMILLLLLFVYVTYNDILRLFR